MKFRLSRRRQANLELKEFDSKAICPSLHDDPAFSSDPHSNPYSVTSHDSWLSPPPLGHPVLKNKKRPNIVLTPHDTPDSDTDFHLVQPPNTPVIPSGSNSSPQYPPHLTTNNKFSMPSSALPSMRRLTSSVMSQGDHYSSLHPTPEKKERMNFLSRRQSAQHQPIKSFFPSFGRKERRRSELPASAGDPTLPSQPVQHTKDLPTSASVAHQIPGYRGLVQDYDQIDELDETNPWGIPIHHDGRYEAVNVQLNKRVGNRVPLGPTNNDGLYNMHTLQANGQVYIPPQAPTGVSLNLSPGQILSRQLLVPFIQPASMSNAQSPSGPHVPAEPILTPPHVSQYMVAFPDIDSGSKVHDNLAPIQETIQNSHDLSFDIGMAMLESDQAELSDKRDFDLYDLANLKFENRRAPPSLVSAQPESSQGLTSQDLQGASSTGTTSNKPDVIRPAGHSRNDSDPPMYNEHIGDEDAGRQLLYETPSREQQQSQLSSQTSRNLATVVGTGLQQLSNKSNNEIPPSALQNVSFLSPDSNIPRPTTVIRDQRIRVTEGTQHISPAQTSLPFLHTNQNDLPSRLVNYESEPDVQSTHYSTSTHSSRSSQSQNQKRPPLHRHVPKRLVMPTPLNTGQPLNATASLHVGRVPPSEIPSQVNAKQTYFQPSSFKQRTLPRSPLSNLPMTPIHHFGNARVDDAPSGAGKLRKRMSTGTPTPAPVITTVSFAPPIIGFHHSATSGKVVAHSKTDKIPKKLLSKRMT